MYCTTGGVEAIAGPIVGRSNPLHMASHGIPGTAAGHHRLIEAYQGIEDACTSPLAGPLRVGPRIVLASCPAAHTNSVQNWVR